MRLREQVSQGVQKRVVASSAASRRGVVLEEAVPEGATVVEGLGGERGGEREVEGTLRKKKIVRSRRCHLSSFSLLSLHHKLTCKTLLQ